MKMLSVMLLAALLASQANAFVCEHSYSDGPKCSQRSLSATYTNNKTSDKVVQITVVGKNSTPKVSITVDGKSYTPETGPIVIYEHHATGAIASVPPGSTYSINASGSLEYWMWGEE